MNSSLKKPNLSSVTSINPDGSRYKIHPADVSGPWTRWRRVAAYALIAFFVILPWLQINGHPAVFLDVADRRFHLFGLTLSTQDIWLFFFLVSGLGFTLFYVTALLGRVWCGWTCPQTVYLEHVYRVVERWIEGDQASRRRLDDSRWTGEKLLRRGGKYAVFAVLSFLIAHIFLAYFVSLPHLWKMMTHDPVENWGAFVFVGVFTAILYFNFTWFREQLCIAICPYGRLQSALIDDDSVVIGYDGKRGEPRGKATLKDVGDCVDCRRCVQVCPTGIDIREGLQMECIGCAACVDACDGIMEKLNRPKGLVRYDSLNGLAGKPRRIIRPRTVIYTLLLAVGALVFLFSASLLQPATMTVVRMAGQPFFADTSVIRNQFQMRLFNKSSGKQQFKVVLPKEPHGLKALGLDEEIELKPQEESLHTLILTMPAGEFEDEFPVTLILKEGHGTELTAKLVFLGPAKK